MKVVFLFLFLNVASGCSFGYEGIDCTTLWISDPNFNIAIIIYTTCEDIFQFILVSFSSYQLIISFYKSKQFKRNIVTFIHLIFIIAGLLRIIGWTIDPQSIRGIITPSLSSIFSNIPIVLWLVAVLLLAIYCSVELQLWSEVQVVTHQRVKPIFIVCMVLSVVVVIPLGILGQIYDAAMKAFFVSLEAIMLGIIVFFFIGGIRLRRFIKGKSQSLQGFLWRLYIYIWIVQGCCVVLTIAFIVYDVLNAPAQKWLWYGLQFFFRIVEFVCIGCTQLFLFRKRSSNQKNPSYSFSDPVMASSEISTSET